MMKEKIEQIILSLVSYQSGIEIFRAQLLHKKMLVGRFENADICLQHPTVSHYHAIIIISPDGQSGLIKDLASENGIKVNDHSAPELFFSIGDCISIGGFDLYVEESLHESINKTPIINRDLEVERVNENIILPQRELRPKDGLELIDGEYCDIIFDESQFNPSNKSNPLLNDIDLKSQNYIDVEEAKSIRKNLISENIRPAIEVSILSSGNILSIHYLPMKNGTYYGCGVKKRHAVLLDGMLTNKKVPFIKIEGQEVQVHDLSPYFTDELGKSENHKVDLLQVDDVLVYTINTTQIFIRRTSSPARHRHIPFFQLDKILLKNMAITFIPMLFLALAVYFIDTKPPQEEPKKIAVLYRPAVKADKRSDDKSKEIADRMDMNKGVKEQEQKETLPQFAAASAQKPKQTQQASKPATEVTKQPAKIKPYEFKSEKLTTLFGNNSPNPNIKHSAEATTTNNLGLTANTGEVSTQDVKAVGTMGKDAYGSAQESYGAQGLSSKRGADTAYVAPKTVILGSMDPELLRKILREYLPQFKHCYQQELDKHSDNVKGTVNLDFRIGEDGLVKSAKVEGAQAKFSASGEECMRQVLRRIVFPKPKGGGVVDVRQPLNFFSERTKM